MNTRNSASPWELRFKVLSIAGQIFVNDSSGRLLYYVKQKAFKLKEAVTVFSDAEQTRPEFRMAADRILDISARYDFTDMQGAPLGALQRQGMRSIWRAHYDILRDGAHVMSIREENPWIKLVDGILGDIPLVGLVAGYILHPTYRVTSAADEQTVLLRVRKRPAFWEGKYTLEKPGSLDGVDSQLALLSVMMFLLLERTRG